MISTPRASQTPARRVARKPRRRWLLALFSLPFAGIGIWILALWLVPALVDGVRMQSWEQGTARLTGAGVESSEGDGSDTSRAWATYTYEYAGRQYTGDRAAITTARDNIGDFQQQLGRRLAEAYRNQELVPVWISPDAPSESVLNRDVRWGLLGFFLLFGVVFGGAGLGMLWFALKPRPAVHASVEHPDSPWLSRPEWASAEIGSSAKSVLAIAWIFAVLWNAVAVPLGAVSIREFLDGSDTAAFGLLFPLVGIGLLAWALRTTLRWRRFGRTTLVMDPYPGAIGGHVGGTIRVRVPYDASHGFRASLTCLHSRITGSGKNRRRRESVVWQAAGYAHAAPDADGTRLEILFDVQNALPASEPPDGEAYHLWRLHVEAELPGADFERSFEIPVFPTGQHARALRRLSTEHRAAEQERARAIDNVLDVQQIPGGVELYFPAFRNPGAKLTGLLIGAIFVGVCVFTAGTDAPIPLRVVFGAVGSAITLASLYSLFVSLRVRVDHATLATRKRLLGLPAGGRTLRRDEITGITLKESYNTSSGNKHTLYFKLQALTTSGEAITIGYNLAGRETARQALDSLSRMTGVPVAGALEENALA